MLSAVILVAQLLSFFTALPFTTAKPFEANVLPLAVRNPYLSLWQQNARLEPWLQWPIFWTGSHVGMSAMAYSPSTRQVYPLFGRVQDALRNGKEGGYNLQFANYTGSNFDASVTNLTYSVEGVKVVLSFSSPITPTDIEAQSLPATYLEVILEGHQDLDVYVDVNGQWLTNDARTVINWDLHNKDNLRTWKVAKQQQELFTERRDRAEWGTFYFTTAHDESIDYEAGVSGAIRQKFAASGVLQNSFESRFRSILDEEPIFAFCKHFQPKKNASEPTISRTLFTIALTQDPIVQFAAARGLTEMRPLWKFHHTSDFAMLKHHYYDYSRVSKLALDFSNQMTAHATSTVSSTYARILALSARQVLGATYFSGTPNSPLLFLKEISSNGNFQTVDVIFPASPFFLYASPSWLAYLLEPLLEHQDAGLYPNKYSMHDLGAHFPNATGHSDGRDEEMPVEECGNMLIMALSYAQALISEGAAKNDTASGVKAARKWITKDSRYGLWKRWTSYLVDAGLYPAYQLSTDDFAGRLANQTNLAVKALVGIRAMSELAAIVGEHKDAKFYREISDKYYPIWEDLALSRDKTHTKLAYHWYGSWGTLYNLYNDALLCFHHPSKSPTTLALLSSGKTSPPRPAPRFRFDVRSLETRDTEKDKKKPFFPPKIYTLQSKWYLNVLQTYGLPLDVRHFYTKSDWEFYAAAIASPKVLKKIVDTVGEWLNMTPVDLPFTDLYDTESGRFPGINFKARPVVGGHFSVLVLEGACGGEGLREIQRFYEDEDEGEEKVDVKKSLEDDVRFGAERGRLEWKLESGKERMDL
ncbi:DUF1793-domain-containing protein [Ascobolus immersus RN42]|uniref:DUF1793-domain-containing protein n=1 Tax=Ascobolus immersus RN42 TaxID=1160509 RepID=A0A3N4I404_ASCIM|nr:DUF1793-domain-containing protein [Ascobolus immersus RN42]